MEAIFARRYNFICHVFKRNLFRANVFDQFSASIVISSSKLNVSPSDPVVSTADEVLKKADPESLKQYKKPVDWLPFHWRRRPMFNIFKQSGDLILKNPIDPACPKPDFELSEELKTAPEDVKKIFSLETASRHEAEEAYRRSLLKRVQRHPFDFTSLEVKIALRTIRIRSLFLNSEIFPKEIRLNRVILPMVINRRNRDLKVLRQIDHERFSWLCKELQIYYNPPTLGKKLERYCKKWDLRRLTKLYHDSLIQKKKNAYHEELKKQQKDFLKEKAETLAWIEAEEKALKEL
ncbi:28S ribosomal protein S15, mitochondrial-like [Uloborus diversus]|uniref:28S ribosomal protein S15, mitochondrial-like n=1 Tax=Uloborus diversus TaxID=327109 RepID=UPI00240A05D7|nr:28S ribosomal protein S15, mitochondrial-like [Uloborus diversus]